MCSVVCLANSNVHNATESPKANQTTLYADVQERSLFNDLPRQGRIINDDKISIKGFIPIVGLGEDSVKDNNNNKENIMEQYMKNMALLSGNSDTGNPLENLPQHVAQPEDQRFIGAALQGLLGNVGSTRQ